MADEHVKTCEACGASVYPEHIDSGIAGYHGGQLVCAHCLAEKNKAVPPEEEGLEAIAVDVGAASQSPGSTSIHGFSGSDTLAAAGFATDDESKFSRRLDPRSPFGTRCRTFHAKLSAGAVDYMNQQVNTWADSNPDINIKFATSTIGVFEGKQKDLHLIITVFY